MSRSCVIAIFLLLFSPLCNALMERTSVEDAFVACRNQFSAPDQSEARLACYDAIAITEPDKSNRIKAESTLQSACTHTSGCGYLDRKWRLSSGESHEIADLETHRLNYLTVTKTSNPNQDATNPVYTVPQNRELDNKDLKFQVSFKTELMRSIPYVREFPRVETSRLWAAYTQQSFWQVFDSRNSRPMREHNFAPELILSLGLDNRENGERVAYRPRMLNIGLIHESNGRSQPISRSWNRLYLESGWEVTDQFSVMLRPWWRIPESSDNDDNPDITRYLGYGDLNLHWEDLFKHVDANLLLRNNMRSDNKGYAKLDLQFQPFLQENLKLHFMLSSGYGDSLVDYNHAQTVWGLGVSIGE